MRLRSGLKLSAVIALAVPAMLFLTASSTMADSSPSPAGAALPGDPAKGETLFGPNCASCHGAALGGGIGAQLNPIELLAGVKDKNGALDPKYLIDTITNGRVHQPGDPAAYRDMPVKGGNPSLTDQDVADLASYIIQANNSGAAPLTAGELAKSTMTWVTIGILAMLFVTYLLAQYNMRWIARRAAARRK